MHVDTPGHQDPAFDRGLAHGENDADRSNDPQRHQSIVAQVVEHLEADIRPTPHGREIYAFGV